MLKNSRQIHGIQTSAKILMFEISLCIFSLVSYLSYAMYTLIMHLRYVVPKPRSQCSKPEQLVVTFIAGYIAGVFCAIVSHPADTIVSKLNQDKSATFMGVAKNLGWAGRCMTSPTLPKSPF